MPSPATPISILPPEVLGEIFYHCSLVAADAPLVVAAVSKVFRQTVFNTPTAWRRLRLLVSSQGEAEAVRKAKLWMSFAGSCTMNVYLDLTHPEPSSPPCVVFPPVAGVHAAPSSLVGFPLVQEFLQQNNLRLRSLALRTTTQGDAQSFLQAIYSAGQDQFRGNDMSFPLYKVTVHVVADHTRAQLIPQIPFTLPDLPQLSSIYLTNANIPFLPSSTLRNITSLSVIRPLRAQPLPAYAVSTLLRSTPRLSYFKLDSRIEPIAFAPPIPHADDNQDDEMSQSDNDHPSSGLITLPHLTHLILRANHLPLLLDHLVVPDLHHFVLSDLDSKRPNAAYETANALREILVRMDLPVDEMAVGADVIGGAVGRARGQDCEACAETSLGVGRRFGTRGVGGLHTLDLENVSLGRPAGTQVKDEDGIWEWCFRRMKALRSVKAVGMDTEKLFQLLSLRSEGKDDREAGEEGSPDLEKVVVALAPLHSSLVQLQKKNPGLRVDVASSSSLSSDMVLGSSVELGDLLWASASEEDSPEPSPLPRTPLSAGFVGGFGFGSSFDRSRKKSIGL